jgi:hypothetical protein
LLLFNIFSLSLVFRSLTVMNLGVGLLWFSLFEFLSLFLLCLPFTSF